MCNWVFDILSSFELFISLEMWQKAHLFWQFWFFSWTFFTPFTMVFACAVNQLIISFYILVLTPSSEFFIANNTNKFFHYSHMFQLFNSSLCVFLFIFLLRTNFHLSVYLRVRLKNMRNKVKITKINKFFLLPTYESTFNIVFIFFQYMHFKNLTYKTSEELNFLFKCPLV